MSRQQSFMPDERARSPIFKTKKRKRFGLTRTWFCKWLRRRQKWTTWYSTASDRDTALANFQKKAPNETWMLGQTFEKVER